MNQRLIILFLSLVIGWGLYTNSQSYVMSTVNVSTCLYNANFDIPNLGGWSTSFTLSKTTVYQTTYGTRTVIALQSLYSNANQAYDASIISIDTTVATVVNTTTYNINVSTNMVNIVHDAIQVRVVLCGDSTYGGATITGQFSCLMRSALSLNSIETTPLIYEKAFLQSMSADSVLAVASTWNILTFTFPTHGECDWWQLRNITLTYRAAPNQPTPTRVLIDRIELYAIQVKNDN